jgi:hypothetical protein
MVAVVVPDLIRHPEAGWIPAYAGMTGVIILSIRGWRVKRGMGSCLGFRRRQRSILWGHWIFELEVCGLLRFLLVFVLLVQDFQAFQGEQLIHLID